MTYPHVTQFETFALRAASELPEPQPGTAVERARSARRFWRRKPRRFVRSCEA